MIEELERNVEELAWNLPFGMGIAMGFVGH